MDNIRDISMRAIVHRVLKHQGSGLLKHFDFTTIQAVSINQELLQRLLRDNQDTEYGRKYHFSDIKSIDDYRKNVPMTTYEDYEGYINRMTENGERSLLTNYPIAYYASTSGTSGSPKKIPVTDKGLQVFRDYSTTIFFAIASEYYKTTLRRESKNGAVLTFLSLSQEKLKDGIFFGSSSAACMDNVKMRFLPFTATTPVNIMQYNGSIDLKYLHARYALAEKGITHIAGAYIPAIVDIVNYIVANHEQLEEDIRKGRIGTGIQMPDELRTKLEAELKPNPARADEVAAIFKENSKKPLMLRLWPNLQIVIAIWAGNFSAYARKLQSYTGKSIPYFTNTYVASEGVFGMARHPYDQSYVLIPDSCFYEFIPADGEAAENESDNPETVLIDQVEQGKEYELVITNQSGFYRYRMGDVIRVIGFYNESPMVVFKYRKKNIVSIAGEKFTEDHLLSAIKEFERRTNINIIDYCMYPDTDSDPGRYVILMEPETQVPMEKREWCRKILSEELTRASTSYAHYVHGGNMGEPKLIFLQQETFQLHRELRMFKSGISENQIKTIRVLNKPELIRFFTSLADEG